MLGHLTLIMTLQCYCPNIIIMRQDWIIIFAYKHRYSLREGDPAAGGGRAEMIRFSAADQRNKKKKSIFSFLCQTVVDVDTCTIFTTFSIFVK